MGFHLGYRFWQYYGPKWVVSFGGGKIDPTIQGVIYMNNDRFEKEGWIQTKCFCRQQPLVACRQS